MAVTYFDNWFVVQLNWIDMKQLMADLINCGSIHDTLLRKSFVIHKNQFSLYGWQFLLLCKLFFSHFRKLFVFEVALNQVTEFKFKTYILQTTSWKILKIFKKENYSIVKLIEFYKVVIVLNLIYESEHDLFG